jgi:hypothetical protein
VVFLELSRVELKWILASEGGFCAKKRFGLGNQLVESEKALGLAVNGWPFLYSMQLRLYHGLS